MTTLLPEQELPAKKPLSRRMLGLFLKLGFSVGSLWLVFERIDVEQFMGHAKSADVLLLFAALLTLIFAQTISGLRLRYYLSTIGVYVTRFQGVALYFVGMMFNLMLPGGVGGDGYKAWYIKKHLGGSLKKGVQRVLSARANGLLFLLLITYCLSFFSERVLSYPYILELLLLAIPGTILCYSVGVRKLFSEPIRVQATAGVYSFFVQTINLLAAWMILASVGYSEGTAVDYMILFLISCTITILPITLGGIGIREMAFAFGAPYVGTSAEIGVVIAMLYFAINASASLFGVFFWYRLKRESSPSAPSA